MANILRELGENPLDIEKTREILLWALTEEKYSKIKIGIQGYLEAMDKLENYGGENVFQFFYNLKACSVFLKAGLPWNTIQFPDIPEPDPDFDKSLNRAQEEFLNEKKQTVKKEWIIDWNDIEDTGEGVVNLELEELLFEPESPITSDEIISMVPIDEGTCSFRLLPDLMPQYIFGLWTLGFSVSDKILGRYNLLHGVEPEPSFLDGDLARLMLSTIVFKTTSPKNCHHYDGTTGECIFLTPGYQIALKYYTELAKFENRRIPAAQVVEKDIKPWSLRVGMSNDNGPI